MKWGGSGVEWRELRSKFDVCTKEDTYTGRGVHSYVYMG